MKHSRPIGWLVFGALLGGFAMLFGPPALYSDPGPDWADPDVRAADTDLNTGEQDDADIVLKGIGNSGNNFTFGRSNDVANVFVGLEHLGPLTDEILYMIYDAVRSRALDGDADAARLVAEIAIAQRENDTHDDDDGADHDEDERQ